MRRYRANHDVTVMYMISYLRSHVVTSALIINIIVCLLCDRMSMELSLEHNYIKQKS